MTKNKSYTNFKKFLFNIFFTLVLITPGIVFSQTESGLESSNQVAGPAVFLVAAFVVILIIIIAVPKYPKYDAQGNLKPTWVTKFLQFINRGVPVEKEKDIIMEHGFDGIHELNNTIPPWFNVLFYGTIVFAGVYLIDYHILGSGNVMYEEYVHEVKVANDKREELIKTGAFINEDNVTVLTDNDMLDEGKKIFMTNCSPCHGPDGGGTVGPNLTDKNWIHGGGIRNVFKTIKYGVPSKGMITWQTMMNPKQMQKVASYILTLQGTTPAIGKPPEGTLWEGEKNPVDSTKTNDTLKTKK